jgi:hypothetical protein
VELALASKARGSAHAGVKAAYRCHREVVPTRSESLSMIVIMCAE